jgi:integrase
MGFTYLQSGSWNHRMYASVNIATGNPIIDDGTGKPLRAEDGSLAARSLGRAKEGQPKFRRLISQAGKPIKVQQSLKLVERDDDRHKSERSTAVLLRIQQLQERVDAWEADAARNDGTEELRPDNSMTVAAFFSEVFMPHIQKNRQASTGRSYQAYWDAYLADHFNHSKTLRGYEPFQGTNLLEKLAAEYSDNTVNHVRALACSIFTYACSKGYLKYNPWRDVKKTTAGTDVEDGYAYSQKEVERILAALETVSGREEESASTAQMAVILGFYAGLRPSETAGLRWENVDFDNSTITINHAYVNGHFKGTKNKKIRTIQMLPVLAMRLRLWAADKETKGWVLPNRSGENPVVMNDLSARIIGPALKQAGLTWEGFYALRRGGITAMVLAGATLQEVADFAGNTAAIVEKHYFKDKKNQLAASGVAKWAAAMAGGTGRKRQPALAAGEVNQ